MSIRRASSVIALIAFALVTVVLVPRARTQESRPDWPHLVTSTPPDAWRLEGTDPRATWKAIARLTKLEDATTTAGGAVARVTGANAVGDGSPAAPRMFLRFVAGEAALVVAVPALPKEGPLACALEPGLEVEVTLVESQGFKGVARGLTVREARPAGTGKLLLAFDDGGYGPALGPTDCDDTTLTVAAIERIAGSAWQPVPVSFRRGGDEVTLQEGQTAALGRSGLAAALVVSRALGGPPPTDIDTTPRSWILYRIKGQ